MGEPSEGNHQVLIGPIGYAAHVGGLLRLAGWVHSDWVHHQAPPGPDENDYG